MPHHFVWWGKFGQLKTRIKCIKITIFKFPYYYPVKKNPHYVISRVYVKKCGAMTGRPYKNVLFIKKDFSKKSTIILNAVCLSVQLCRKINWCRFFDNLAYLAQSLYLPRHVRSLPLSWIAPPHSISLGRRVAYLPAVSISVSMSII